MKIYIFGSCSGTEPFPGRHHTAWAIEINGRLYWFDAGEGCAYTAHLMGVDLLSVSEIFISHPHIDHVAGLPHLLATIRKLYSRTGNPPKYGDITVYGSSRESFDGVMTILYCSGGKAPKACQTLFERIGDGLLFENRDVRVSAVHNLHLPPSDEGYRSYSFLIEAEGKRIVYSGDIRSFDELGGLLSEGADLLLCETGHHDPREICAQLEKNGVKRIHFLHHGRAIMQNYDALLTECREIFAETVFCNDKDVFEL